MSHNVLQWDVVLSLRRSKTFSNDYECRSMLEKSNYLDRWFSMVSFWTPVLISIQRILRNNS